MWSTRAGERPSILVIGFRKFSQLIHAVAPEFEAEARVTIVDYVFEREVSADDEVQRSDADVVVSAGANAAYLEATLNVPVLTLEVSENDLLEALIKARSLGQRLLLITYEELPLERPIALARSILDADITHRTYRTPDEAREIIYLAGSDRFDAVVAPSYTCALAEQQGLKSILLYSRESCRALLKRALAAAHAGRRQRAERALRQALLDDPETPMLIAADDGDPIGRNAAAERELGVADEARAAAVCRQLCAEAARFSETGQMTVELAGRTWHVHARAVVVAGKPGGWVFRLRGEPSQPRSGDVSTPRHMVYVTDTMARVHELVTRFSNVRGTVLISGESGTGKELVARELHRLGPGADGEFVAVNCGAIPEELFESELFGYVDGAFTSSRRGGRTGLLHAAGNGVFFLDEISEMPLSQQAKLLRVLQERRVRPIGSNRELAVDARLVCSTNRDLATCVREGTFREDLYYRINVFNINLPPLRDRSDDIPAIARYLAGQFCQHYGLGHDLDELMEALTPALLGYHWPGNVRELENVMERLVVGRDAFDSTERFTRSLAQLVPEWYTGARDDQGSIRANELALIREAMARFDGDRTRAAEWLGISPTTLWRRLKMMESA